MISQAGSSHHEQCPVHLPPCLDFPGNNIPPWATTKRATPLTDLFEADLLIPRS